MSKTHGLTPPQGLELFDWEARWTTDVVPVLDHPKVKQCLKVYQQKRGKNRDPLYKGMHPFLPYQCGREPDEGWEFLTKTDLAAYRPIGDCHWIVHFAAAVGKQIYPELAWRAVGEGLHTVAVGFRERAEGTPQYRKTCGRIEVVSDLLMTNEDFDWTAENAIAYSAFWRFSCQGFNEFWTIDRDTVRKSQHYYDGMIDNLTIDFLLAKEHYTPEVMNVINEGKMYLD